MDRITLLRAAALYLPLSLAGIAWFTSSPSARDRSAVFLATAWNVPALLGVHAAALRLGWWSYGVRDATLAGFPVDLYIGWAVAWGALPAIVGRIVSISIVVPVAVFVDLIAMPRLSPVVQLGRWWIVGEVVAVLLCLVPSQLLAMWTRTNTRLPQRALLHALAFSGLALGVLPAAILEWSSDSWTALLSRPGWLTGMLAQLVGVAALLGVSAVQEFAARGGGTPVPFDPPTRIVTSGPYAYVRNPMQLSASLVMLGWGALLESWWVAAAGVMAVVYGAGFAAGDERGDLVRRFGDRWTRYERAVRSWVPRWRPIDARAMGVESLGTSAELTPRSTATLYVAEECGPCSEVRRWFEARSPVGLEIVAAERHPRRTLTRITYDPGDGTADAVGVAALGRALEHVHLGYALIGMFMRVPGVCWFLQLVTDASGGAPRRAIRYCDRPGTHHCEGESFLNWDHSDLAETAGSKREFGA